MSLLRTLFSLGKGLAADANNALNDQQALRLLDQEIRDIEAALEKARTELTGLIAKRSQIEQAVQKLLQQIETYEERGYRAQQAGDRTLAQDVALKIDSLEREMSGHSSVITHYQQAEAAIRNSLQEAQTQLLRLKQERDAAQATEAVQKVQTALASQYTGVQTSLQSATEALDRLKQRQSERAARFSAAEQVEAEKKGHDLDARLDALDRQSRSAEALPPAPLAPALPPPVTEAPPSEVPAPEAPTSAMARLMARSRSADQI